MNSLRNKLIASVTMLAVAAVMLTSASFAWYTVSTKGEVTAVEATLKATKNLEIARANDEGTEPSEVEPGDYGNLENWGSTIDDWGTVEKLDYVATVATIDSNVGIASAPIKSDGRLGDLAAATAPTSTTDGVGYYTSALDENGTVGNVAVAYCGWIRSNVTGTISAEITNATDAAVVIEYDGEISSDGTYVYLTANKAVPVKIIVFFDGEDENMTAEMVADGDLEATGIGVTFTSSAVQQPTSPAES